MEPMAPLEIDKAPLEVPRADRKAAHWLKPELVAEIAFTEFTGDGILRHPSFIALREDKPAATWSAKSRSICASRRRRPSARPPRVSGSGSPTPTASSSPRTSCTKGDLADYYAAIEALMMVDTARRPITLIRCPQGRAKHCFFQKHDSGTMGEQRSSMSRSREKNGEIQDYLYVDDVTRPARPASRWGRSNSTAGAAGSRRSSIPTGWCSTSIPTSGSISRR